MNSTTILLAATGLMLAVAFFFSYGALQKVSDQPEAKNELRELRETVARLRAETLALRSLPRPTAYAPSAVTPPSSAPETSPLEPVTDDEESEIARLEAEMAGLKNEKETAVKDAARSEHKAEAANEEALWALSEKTRAADRADQNRRRIQTALKLGEVTSFDSTMGFLVFTPNPQIQREFTAGEKLAIRRNDGILGRATLSTPGTDQISADVMPNAIAGGLPEVRPGDEIILLPDYYDAPEGLEEPADSGISIPAPVGVGEPAPQSPSNEIYPPAPELPPLPAPTQP